MAIYSEISKDPENYNIVEFHPKLPCYSDRFKWYISSINTFANFLVTTTDDFLEFNDETYYFENRCEYDIAEIPIYLTKLINDENFKIYISSDNLLCIESLSKNVKPKITNASNRVKMLLGLENMNFPLIDSKIIIAKTSPKTMFGNILYLRSFQGYSLETTKDDKNLDINICYRINTFLKSGLPIIINKKQDVLETNYENILKIKIELVDKNFEPIILKSPLKIDLVIKPIYKHNFKHKQ